MKRETKKRLSQRDLKALGTSPNLVLRRIPPPEKSPTGKEGLKRR